MIYKYKIERVKESSFFSLCILQNDTQILEPNDFLSSEESCYYQKLTIKKRQQEFLISRLSAKYAIQKMIKQIIPLQNIQIEKGVFEFPLIRTTITHNLNVSISHSGKYAVSICFPDAHPMGIDIEMLQNIRVKVMKSQFTIDEWKLLDGKFTEELCAAHLWTAKEALSKVLKTGLMIDFKLLEIGQFKRINESMSQFFFKNFSQYQAITYRTNTFVLALVFPRKSSIIDFTLD